MQCGRCGHESPPAARFCGACGASFDVPCAACQAPNPSANRFCQQCGAALAAVADRRFDRPESYTPKHLADKILQSRTAIEGERKQVSVLFVDVSGFTSLAERLDPEDVHAIMTRAFELMLEQVHAYEGTVNQFLGDGIMALFGAPVAHEDHARRAALAAVGIRGTLGQFGDGLWRTRKIRFHVRQGVNTGLVVVGSIGSDLRMDYTAVGDTTNVAARLLQAAAPDQVLVSAATQRLVAGYFVTSPVGDLPLKGKSDPIGAFTIDHALDERHRLQIAAEHGLTPHVGRSRELSVLSERFDDVCHGRGAVVLISGESGIGKSRLLHEFRQRIGDTADWREAHCLSFGHAMALHPLVALLRRWFEVDEGDTDAVVAEKIDLAISRLGDSVARARPYLRALLALPADEAAVDAMTPQQRRAETFEALGHLFARAGARRPQVVVLEDLQWADQATDSFLASFADSVPACRLLLVLVHRPGYAVPLGERSDHSRLVLGPLSRDQMIELVRAVRADAGLPSTVEGLIADKADGNPFYAEELAKMFRDTGVAESVPQTIQDIIAARIDRLDDRSKRTLQVAAVVGREFRRRVVESLVDRSDDLDGALRALVAAELLVGTTLVPERTYAFRHALTHEVAYASLLVQRRRDLHGRAAAVIEALFPDRLAEHAEVLAHHWSRAEAWDRAFGYLVASAERAARAFALRDALALYGEALAAADRCPDAIGPPQRLPVHRARADLLFALGDYEQSRREAEEAMALAGALGDRASEANAVVQSALALQWAQDFPAALEYADRAVALGQAGGVSTAVAGGLWVTGFIHGVTGRIADARVHLERALPIAHAAGDVGLAGVMGWFVAAMDIWQGRYADALTRAAEGARVARAHHLVLPLVRCLWAEAAAHAGLGDYQRAVDLSREMLALSERIGDEAFFTRFLNTLGWLHIDCGDVETGTRLNEECRALARRSPHATGVERVAFTLVNDADGFLARGDLPLAAEALDEALGIVRAPPPSRWMTWRYAVHCYVSLGELALARGDVPAAERWAREALAIAEPTHSHKYASRAHRLLGEAATLARRWEEATASLAAALGAATRIAEPRQTWKSHVALARLLGAMKEPERARASYTAAHAVLMRVAGTLVDGELRAGLARLPEVREVLAELRQEL